MDTFPIPARSLERYFKIEGRVLERCYKEHMSGFREWEQFDHASDWILLPWNMGERLSIDESMHSKDLFTFLSNKDGHGKRGTLIAAVRGTKSEDVVRQLMQIPEVQRKAVTETKKEEREFNRKKARAYYRKKHPRKRGQKRGRPRLRSNEKFKPSVLSNGDTKVELLTRARYILPKSGDKWSENQKKRAGLLFEQQPKLKEAYSLVCQLRCIFKNRNASHTSKTYSRFVPQRRRGFPLHPGSTEIPVCVPHSSFFIL